MGKATNGVVRRVPLKRENVQLMQSNQMWTYERNKSNKLSPDSGACTCTLADQMIELYAPPAPHPYVTSGGYTVCIECGLRKRRPLSAEKHSVTSEEVLALEACLTSSFLPYALSPQPEISAGRKFLEQSNLVKRQCRSWDCFFSIYARAAS
jgi:hypothetical protein